MVKLKEYATQPSEIKITDKEMDKGKMKQLKKAAIEQKEGIYIKLDMKNPYLIFNGKKSQIKDLCLVYARRDHSGLFYYDNGDCLTNMALQENFDEEPVDDSLVIIKETLQSNAGEVLEKGLKLFLYQDQIFQLSPGLNRSDFYDFACLYLRTADFVFVCVLDYGINGKAIPIIDCTNLNHNKRLYKILIENVAKLMAYYAAKYREGSITRHRPIELPGGKSNA